MNIWICKHYAVTYTHEGKNVTRKFLNADNAIGFVGNANNLLNGNAEISIQYAELPVINGNPVPASVYGIY